MENLNELEITKIEQFCADKDMYNAVKKVLLAGIYYQGTPEAGLEDGEKIINGAYSLVAQSTTYPIDNEILGQNLKAQWAGINMLKNGFNDLSKIKSDKEIVESPYNEAV